MKSDITSLKMHAALLAQFRCLRDVTVDFWASALPFRAGLARAPYVHHDLIPLKFQCCIVGALVSRFVHALKTVVSRLFSCHNFFNEWCYFANRMCFVYPSSSAAVFMLQQHQGQRTSLNTENA